MNDFDFDCAQKKRIARGAFNRKGTTNRKGCRLPHENLTKKELEKLNGEVFTLSITRPITWEQFKKLPNNLQEEYLNTQVKRFGVGMRTIGQDLFGLAGTSLQSHINKHGLCIVPAPNGQTPKAAKESWNRWIATGTTIAPEPETTTEPTPETTPIAAKEPEPEVKPFRAHDYRAATQVTMCEEALRDAGLEREDKCDQSDDEGILYPLTGMTLELKGTPIDILATLRMSFPALLDKDKTYRFTIRADTFVISPPGRAL